jgi:predicted nuclease with RNAse H fold
MKAKSTVVGIDVGGNRKGYHAVALRSGKVFDTKTSTSPAEIVTWCLDMEAAVVSVDAPCRWSRSDSSRQAEKDLKVAGKKVHCFATPTKDRARSHKGGFYDWVFNGEKLYELLAPHYPLYDGTLRKRSVSFETFPHAIVCSLQGKVVQAKPKLSKRRKVLCDRSYDVSMLSNIDLVDAALCAVAAEEFVKGHTMSFGEQDEGFIVVPNR